MSLRDWFVVLSVFGSLPFIIRRPWLGIIVWTWLGFMNPHRLAWGFSTSMPFAQIVAITTLVAMVLSKEPKRLPWTRENIVLAIFVLWMVITTSFAIFPESAWLQLQKVLKIQLMIFVAMILINTRERLHMLVWTIAASLAFYGVKGGIFTILTGGSYRVNGPQGSFIGGNNEIGLALAMTVPLMYYLFRQTKKVAVRTGLAAAMVLTSIAAIGTHSRGALLGMAAMGAVLWLRGRQKILIMIIGAASVFAVAQIMPEAWYARMATIEDYQTDQSARGRLEAWGMAYNMARDRFLGGGFESFRQATFAKYAQDESGWHDSHSIYFQILGHHGFVGLGLFLVLGLLTWLSASKIRRHAQKEKETVWLADLCGMVQVSLVAYATAGAFLGMAYFDLYYNLVLIVVVSRVLLAKQAVALSRSTESSGGSYAPAPLPNAPAPFQSQGRTLL